MATDTDDVAPEPVCIAPEHCVHASSASADDALPELACIALGHCVRTSTAFADDAAEPADDAAEPVYGKSNGESERGDHSDAHGG